VSSLSSTTPEIDPLEIRRAAPEDAARLTVIARAAKAHWGYPAAWLTTWEPVLTITPDYVGRAIVFVGTRGGAPIGFYALEPREDRWSLEHMWIEPGEHGRGAGRRLFTHALDTIRELRPGVLIIEADPFAAGFYVRMGARQTGTVAAPVEGAPNRLLPVFEIDVSTLRLERPG
jgi:GNAT superfamily N-acetyltransferase